jgi:hypothetical protein
MKRSPGSRRSGRNSRNSDGRRVTSLGVEAIVAPVHDIPEVEFLVSKNEPDSGLVVIPDAFSIAHRAEITLLANRYRVPAVYWSRSFAELGGLISYAVLTSSMSTCGRSAHARAAPADEPGADRAATGMVWTALTDPALARCEHCDLQLRKSLQTCTGLSRTEAGWRVSTAHHWPSRRAFRFDRPTAISA